MRLAPTLVLTALAVLGSIALFKGVTRHLLHTPVPKHIVAQYAEWKNAFQKLYATPAEDAHRLTVFYHKVLFVEKANTDYSAALWNRDGAVLESPMFAVNEFSDLTEEEFVKKYTGLKETTETLAEYDEEKLSLPDAAGLEQSGYEVRIRHQLACGCCWAFAAMATFEKQYFDSKKQRLDLSHQELVDCTPAASGCNGGPPASGLVYMAANSVALASAYPYIAARQACKNIPKVPKISVEMKNPLFTTSLAVKVINAGKHPTVNLYASGKFASVSKDSSVFDASLSGDCSRYPDHAVAIVGQSAGAFRLQNSWGRNWGEAGLKYVKPCSDTHIMGLGTSLVWVE